MYLDVWHKDILAFLDLKLNNGDERLRAHDVFPGICIPDIFMEAVEKRGEFHLFDPHEVRQVMGYLRIRINGTVQLALARLGCIICLH